LLEYAAGSVSPAFGKTKNPLDLTRTSGGSSSGSAALVADGVVNFALGSDTGGSIRIPAAYCGIVGLKPTYGLVPTTGVFPLSTTLDHCGPMTRTVKQAATLLSVMADVPITLSPPPSGIRLGVLRRQMEDPDLVPAVRERVSAAITSLADATGGELVDVDITELDLVDDCLGTILLFEAYAVHRELLASEGDGYAVNTKALLEMGRTVSEEQYKEGLDAKQQIVAGFNRVLLQPGQEQCTGAQVHVLLGPSVAYPALLADPPVGTPEGDVEGRYSSPYNCAGIPAVSVPCGTVEGRLPAGLQIAGAAGQDALVLSVAQAYEAVAPGPSVGDPPRL
jgi:aspartyl-tRNA(Asn)/glutamyl-tRNA(Gln) amidotransferase subunit A